MTRNLGALDDHECVALDEAVRTSGHCIFSEALQSVVTETTCGLATIG